MDPDCIFIQDQESSIQNRLVNETNRMISESSGKKRKFLSNQVMKKDTPHILLINPWIHDFAAYDFWAKPLGLLTIAGILRLHGYEITYIDCLDRFHPELTPLPRGGNFT
jgi:hypothetical protein